MHNLRSPLLSVARLRLCKTGVTLSIVPLPSNLERANFIGTGAAPYALRPALTPNSIKPHAAGCDAAAAVPHASVVLEVDDSGVGLTANELQVLNQGEAFTQVGLGQLQGSCGTDLGLAIARDLLRLHGPGHGFTFRLELTLPGAPEGTPDSRTAAAGTYAEGMPGGSADRTQGAGVSKRQARPLLRFPPGFRVLHVEDDAKLGVTFDVAVNGAEAEKREYAHVLMDHQFEAAGLSFCVDKDTPGIHRVAQVIGSFALDEVLDEEPGAGSSNSLTEVPTRKASLATPQSQLP
ncbi:hypothetical protein T492DRAFT_883287 [Pavlovales sp. CCMP2436]|nr:hypothetical protein T492DRAFT_883287 [Pavlovales sp. CCMP2436]